MNLSSGAAEPIPKSVPHQFEYHVSGRGGQGIYMQGCNVGDDDTAFRVEDALVFIGVGWTPVGRW